MTHHEPAAPLPEWVVELVAAIEKSEDERDPCYLRDTVGRVLRPTQCPESHFLALVPEHVRQTARRWAS